MMSHTVKDMVFDSTRSSSFDKKLKPKEKKKIKKICLKFISLTEFVQVN